jgi:hypothetical protein
MLQLSLAHKAFVPGEWIDVLVEWDFSGVSVSEIRVHLLWMISGWNKPEIHRAALSTLHQPGPSGRETVRFEAPPAPSSYNGQTYRIHWTVEAVAQPHGESARAEFILSPTRSPCTHS